jgi:serine/threonine protein kinase
MKRIRYRTRRQAFRGMCVLKFCWATNMIPNVICGHWESSYTFCCVDTLPSTPTPRTFSLKRLVILSLLLFFVFLFISDFWYQIIDCCYDFDDPAWDVVSEVAKDLVKKLIVKDPSQRLTAKACFEHEWWKKQTGKSD